MAPAARRYGTLATVRALRFPGREPPRADRSPRPRPRPHQGRPPDRRPPLRTGARGKGRSPLGGPGRLWPPPRGPGLWGVTRDPRGRVTGERRIRHGSAPPGRSTPGLERSGICAVPYLAIRQVSNTARSPWFEIHLWRGLRTTQIPDRSDLTLSVSSLPRTPHVLGVSWRSQPARTAMRRPGRTSDGRGGLISRPPTARRAPSRRRRRCGIPPRRAPAGHRRGS